MSRISTAFGLPNSVIKITFTAAPREENELYLSSICAPCNVIVLFGRHAKAEPKRDPRACISDLMKDCECSKRRACFPLKSCIVLTV